ncbi:Hexaprenyldihydroxybenzoate methyltransferase, mitochondrial [Podila verticillata]|nr:Hexaprenyldihydroxybenzoate methyltransferase, mitochondrial [Podila verticillata]
MSASISRVTARLRTKTIGACVQGWRHGTQTSFKPMATMVSQRTLSTSSPTKHAHHDQSKQSSSDSIYTVNKDEIAKFAAMSDEWWAPQGPFKMLHLMNPPRIRYIRNRLEASGAIPAPSSSAEAQSRARFPLQGLRILDVGCGGGLLAEALARLGAQVTGLDASMENIEMAKIHAQKDPLLNGGSPGSLEYRHQTAEKLLEQGLQFDVVCSMEVIEHVENPAGFLKVLGQLIKPNGDLILSTMSRTPLAYFLTVFSAEHMLRMVPVGTHHWSKYITPKELEAGVCDLAGCEVLNVQGIGFNPLSGQWELNKNRSEQPVGILANIGASFAERLNTDYTQVKQILAKNALCVRELQTRAFGVFDYLFVRKVQQELSEHPSSHIFQDDFSLDSAVTKLRKLSIMFCDINAPGPSESTLDMMMALISNNPGLTTLEFLEEQNEVELMRLVHACAELKEIYILFPIHPALAKQVLLQLPESIRKVALCVDTYFDYQRKHGHHLYGFGDDHTDPYDEFGFDYDELYGDYDKDFYDDH